MKQKFSILEKTLCPSLSPLLGETCISAKALFELLNRKDADNIKLALTDKKFGFTPLDYAEEDGQFVLTITAALIVVAKTKHRHAEIVNEYLNSLTPTSETVTD